MSEITESAAAATVGVVVTRDRLAGAGRPQAVPTLIRLRIVDGRARDGNEVRLGILTGIEDRCPLYFSPEREGLVAAAAHVLGPGLITREAGDARRYARCGRIGLPRVQDRILRASEAAHSKESCDGSSQNTLGEKGSATFGAGPAHRGRSHVFKAHASVRSRRGSVVSGLRQQFTLMGETAQHKSAGPWLTGARLDRRPRGWPPKRVRELVPEAAGSVYSGKGYTARTC